MLKFLLTCIKGQKKVKDTSHPPSWIFEKSITSQQSEILF